MARPPAAEKRTHHIDVRVTATEKTRIEEAAKQAGLTPSDFIRMMAIQSKPRRKVATPDREILLKAMAELGKQGSNLNQISRALNRRQDSDDLRGITPDLVATTLHAVEMLSRHILQKLDNHGH